MALVHEGVGFELLGQINDIPQRSDVAVHREDAVCHDHDMALILGLVEAALEVLHVHMLVPESLGLAEADTIDDRRMVKLVTDDGVLVSQNRLKEPGVCIEGRWEENSVLRSMKQGDFPLELLMLVLRPADEAHAAHAKATLLQGFSCSLNDLWVGGKPQVVVGAEV